MGTSGLVCDLLQCEPWLHYQLGRDCGKVSFFLCALVCPYHGASLKLTVRTKGGYVLVSVYTTYIYIPLYLQERSNLYMNHYL